MRISFKRNLQKLFCFIAVLLIVLCSNSVYFHQVYGKVTTIIFLIFSIMYFLINNNFIIRISKHNLCLFCIIFITVFFSSLVNYSNIINLNLLIIFFCFLISMLLLMESITFSVFSHYYVFIITLLSIISLIVFYLYEFGILFSTNIKVGKIIYVMCFWENMGWGYNYHRIAGIFWEGGAYQIFINYALLLKFEQLTRKKATLTDLLQIIIMSYTLILTRSTSGYLVFAILIILYFSKIKFSNNFEKRHKYIKIMIGLVPVALFVISIIFSNVVQNKFSIRNESYVVRTDNFYQSISTILDYPLFGVGYYTEYANSRLGINSNGILEMGVFLGVPIIALYIYSYYFKYKEVNFSIPFLFFLLFILFENSTECILSFPISYIFIFEFKKNIKICCENVLETNSVIEGDNSL